MMSSVIVTVSLLTMLYIACTTYENHNACSVSRFPMVSGIIRQPMFDRVWCIVSTFFALTVLQTNVRAFYKVMHGVVDPEKNKNILHWGLIMCFSLPQIGYFDDKNYPKYHLLLAILFFMSTVVYAYKFTNQLYKHKHAYPQKYWFKIKMLRILSMVMIFVFIGFALSF